MIIIHIKTHHKRKVGPPYVPMSSLFFENKSRMFRIRQTLDFCGQVDSLDLGRLGYTRANLVGPEVGSIRLVMLGLGRLE